MICSSVKRPSLKHSFINECLCIAALIFLPFQVIAATWKDVYPEMIQSLLWYQQSAESRGLSWQTWNMARDTLDQALQTPTPAGLKPALITDIDDTLVDATSYFAGFIGTDSRLSKAGSKSWWHQQPVILRPGAKAFLEYASRRGVDILYLTARIPEEQVFVDTLDLLNRAGLPDANRNHLQISSGFQKGQMIHQWASQNHRLILTTGDKMGDLGFDVPEQQALLHANPVYGVWECLSHGSCRHSADEEIHIRNAQAKRLLGNFQPPVDSTHESSVDASREFGQALTWVTRSDEYPYFTRQVFSRAEQLLKQRTLAGAVTRNEAIVSDIDGTLLNLTAYSAAIYLRKEKLNNLPLYHYNLMANAPTQVVPGSVEFLKKASAKGYQIFYVTNRDRINQQGVDIASLTLRSLKQAGFPVSDDRNLLMRGDFCTDGQCSNKRPRFNAIRSGQVTGEPVTVAMMLGDRIDDLELTLQDLSVNASHAPSGKIQQLGRSLFLLPCPLYPRGWLNTLYKQWYGDDQKNVTPEQKARDRLSHIKHWRPALSGK